MTVTGTDGLSITSASYDLQSQTLTVNVSLNTSATGYQAPSDFHIYTDDGSFTNPQERTRTGITQNGSSASLTIGNVDPTQLNKWLNSADGIGLYVDVSSQGQSMFSPTFYQGVQLTAAYWTNGAPTTPTTPTITGDFTDATGATPATNTINGVNYVNGANDTPTQTLTGTADAGDGVTVNITDGNNNTSSITTTADANGKWSIPVGDLTDGTYNFTATATNGPGSSSSDPFGFTVKTGTIEGDISDSAVSNGFINGANFNGGTTTLTGTAEAGDTVSVAVTIDNNTTTQAATVNQNGAWSLQLAGLMNGDVVSAAATATDAAGNTATSDPYSFTVARRSPMPRRSRTARRKAAM